MLFGEQRQVIDLETASPKTILTLNCRILSFSYHLKEAEIKIT